MMDGCCQIYTVGQKNLQFQSAVKLFGHFIYFFSFVVQCFTLKFSNVSLRSPHLSRGFSGNLHRRLYSSASQLEAPPPPVRGKSNRLRLIHPQSPSTSSSQLISSPLASLNTARVIMCQAAPSYYPHDGAASSAVDILNICNWLFLY